MRNSLQKLMQIVLIAGIVILLANSAQASQTMLFEGRWGKEVNQLGVVLPSPGVLPVAPYMCIGGFDVSPDGAVWFSDSVNRMLKCYKDKKWSYIMLNFARLGDLAIYNNKIFVITREPDGVAVIDPEKGKTEKHIKLELKNPGRLKVFDENTLAIEEAGAGVLIKRKEMIYQHPALALEAAGTINRLFGVQYNLEDDSRTIIGAEFAEEIQEPEVIALYEAEEKIIFSKTAGVKSEKPVIMVIKASQPTVLNFILIDTAKEKPVQIDLPIFDSPPLQPSGWKLCSNGEIYGFSADAEKGFKFFKAEKSF